MGTEKYLDLKRRREITPPKSDYAIWRRRATEFYDCPTYCRLQ